MTEVRYRALIDQIDIGAMVYQALNGGSDFLIVDINPAAERLNNMSRADLLGRRATEALPWIRETGLLEALRRVWNTGSPESRPATHSQGPGLSIQRLPSGEVAILYDKTAQPSHGKHRVPQESPEAKLVAEALRESEQRIKLATASGSLGVWDWDIKRNIMTWNEQMYSLYGLNKKSCSATFETWQSAIHPENRVKAIQNIQSALRGESSYNSEYRILLPNGTQRVIRADAIILRDPGGHPVRMIGLNRDITEQRNFEAQLREREEMMRYIIKYDPNAIAVYDENLRYIAVSDRFIQDYNVKDYDMVGKHHYEVFPEMPQRWKDVHKRVLAGAIERNEDDYFVRPDGSITYNRWECRPWYRADGSIGGMITYTEVTTERKQAEFALRAAKESAENAARVKSRFLDMAAHELRTPITGISILIELTQKLLKKGQPVTTSTLDRLKIQSDRLTNLVSDLLEVSRLERGAVHLHLETTNIVALISECISDFQIQEPQRRFVFTPPGPCVEVDIDPLRINQVLSNFIDNAIKYTPKDTPIELSVESTADRFRVSVTDHGVGIPNKRKNELFAPFSRGDTGLEEQSRGLGLGLYISREIIELHHGEIGVISKEGCGSTFYFELPARRAISEHR